MGLLVCGCPDLNEEYLCEGILEGRFGADPIVRVLAVLRYPQQHAIYWPDVAIEIPPIEAGCVCRLHILRAWEGGAPPDPAVSLAAARAEALTRETNESSREILRRHTAGEIRRTRAVVRFKHWQIETLLKEREYADQLCASDPVVSGLRGQGGAERQRGDAVSGAVPGAE